MKKKGINKATRKYNERWYQENKDSLSAKRREQYANDPEYRADSIKRSREYKAQRKKGTALSRVMYRTINGKQERVFTTGMVAELLGCSDQYIRNLHKRGAVPPCVLPGVHRLYTYAQVNLLDQIVTGQITKIDQW